ncbi:hypothetical protein CVIRNUC_002665 [Coccomyxa viridis]|uniref:Uncharacterized protein n=1 Tax=Coccomyxa viridis TaxID=1274662 RepID=A0AAV1HWG4_9CHLO|nr:hypothetical protein CVIRNUC_002665 [Coccomyxa viridis]
MRTTTTMAAQAAEYPPKTAVKVEDRTPSLRMRHLADAASPPPDQSSPTWVLPNLDPTQMATDLGSTLAKATNTLASQLPTTPTGQSPAQPTPQAASASPATTAGDLELPVATQGTEQWAGVVAKAMTAGGMDHGKSMQALQAFKTAVAAKMAKTATTLEKLQKGYVTGFVEEVMKKAVAITPPTFFSSNTNLFQDSVAALNFGFTGVGVSPCAIAVSPVGVGIGATGINIAPQGISIAPTGVNVGPTGASISPTLIAIGPYDTSVSGQGLNIAPALISISPVRTVIN